MPEVSSAKKPPTQVEDESCMSAKSAFETGHEIEDEPKRIVTFTFVLHAVWGRVVVASRREGDYNYNGSAARGCGTEKEEGKGKSGTGSVTVALRRKCCGADVRYV